MRCLVLLIVLCVTLSPLIDAHPHRHSHPAHASSQLTTPHQHSTEDLVRAANIIRNMKTMDAQTPPCTACQWVWGAVVTVLGNNASYTSILSFLNGLCSILGPQYGPTCDSVANKLVSIIPEIQHQIHANNFDDPIAVCSLLSICTVTCCTDNIPQQVHIALTGNMTQMQVTWVTLTTTPSSIVKYSNNSALLSSSSSTGSSYTYTQGGWIGTIHTATMINLAPNTTYYYQVGDPSTGLSQIFQFHTLPSSPNTPIRYAVVGDLGVVQGTDTINDMIASALRGEYDVILHIGDISYANGYEKLWDDYFREIEPMASRIPYMAVPGNHELPFNFTSYISRFPMPGISSGSRTNLYYSIDIGSTHFIAIDSESVIDTAEITDRQLTWLKNDIARANQRRSSGTPGWIVVYMHRPLYCTNNATEGIDCSTWATYLRGKLETIFYDNQVDLVFAGHLHDYERTYSMYQGALDAKGPVYIINGAGGNREGVLNAFTQPAPAWSAYRISEWGWGILTVNSPTNMEWIFHATKGDIIHDAFSFNKPTSTN